MPDKATPSSADKSPSNKVAAIKAVIHKVVKRSPGREGADAAAAAEAGRPVGEGGHPAGRTAPGASSTPVAESQPARTAAKTSAKPAKEVSSKVAASKAGSGVANQAEPVPATKTDAAPAKKAEAAPAKKAEATQASKAAPAPAKKAEATQASKAAPAPAKKAEAAPAKKAEAAPAKKASAAPKKEAAPAEKDAAPAKKAEAAPAKADAAPAKKASAASKKEPAPAKKAERPERRGQPAADTAEPAKPVASADRSAFLESQRLLLLEERQTYTSQAEALKNEADSLALEHEPGDVQFDEEGGEGGTANVDREIDLYLSAQARATVAEIDRALRKIDEGTYGVCESCGQQIPDARLQALPYATLCVNCKSGGLSSRR
jgi:RNA polymerase-binding transcription factor DksA